MNFFLLCATCAYLFFTLALCEDLSQYERLKKSLAAEIAFGKIDYLPPYSEPLSNPVKKQKDFFKLLVLDNEVDLVKGITVHAYKLLFSRYHYPESIFTFAIKEDKLEIFKILIEAVKPEHYEYIDVGFIVVEHGTDELNNMKNLNTNNNFILSTPVDPEDQYGPIVENFYCS